MSKAWYNASAVKVSHFEWLIMYTGVMDQKPTKPISLKTRDDTLVARIINNSIGLLEQIRIWMMRVRTASRMRLPYNTLALSCSYVTMIRSKQPKKIKMLTAHTKSYLVHNLYWMLVKLSLCVQWCEYVLIINHRPLLNNYLCLENQFLWYN